MNVEDLARDALRYSKEQDNYELRRAYYNGTCGAENGLQPTGGHRGIEEDSTRGRRTAHGGSQDHSRAQAGNEGRASLQVDVDGLHEVIPRG